MAEPDLRSLVSDAGRVVQNALVRFLDGALTRLDPGGERRDAAAERRGASQADATPDADEDPNLNGGHGIGGVAPEEGDVPIEEEPTDLSIVGHGHEDKAAWNRERVARLQAMEDEEPALATSSAGRVDFADVGEDIRDDDSVVADDPEPALAENRLDDDRSLEERLIATPGEDPILGGAEFAGEDPPQAEDLNLDDDIARSLEEERERGDEPVEAATT